MRGFEAEFSQAFADRGWVGEITPRLATDRWQRFAADCTAGYPWDLEDYLNDLTMRTVLSEVLEELAGPEAEELRDSIDRIDPDVRRVLAQESFPLHPREQWWLRNSPSYAAKTFSEEFESAYGVRIRPQSRFDDDVTELSRMLADGLTPAEACLRFRDSGRYAAATEGLFLRAARGALGLDRKESRILWSWLTGKTTDAELRSSLARTGR
ncbi:hypothetical protein GCM10010193_37150 [Kitasatospora atroaurantiaca]|uniref:Uncharacterized protein n=1 Tax=Kitasatospora atroaurantiaca TaxID=285545 RepID=A0A561ET05_9ACTN|nr:hypothetical protein [Kitasatospora atroaurantiaca]TWE18742.1 hypothetical protein FB465_3831 [Kitasatospora atroaurantiaca]